MRINTRLALLLAATLPCSEVALAWTSVGPGIEYQTFQLADPNNVFVARMDRSNVNSIIESSIGQGRLSGGTERVSGQAARYDDAINYWYRDWGRRNDVIVAVNGDFWNTSTGVPLSGQVQGGWLAKQFTTSGFVWRLDRTPLISGGGFVGLRILHTASGATQNVDGINRSRGTNELILYTPQYDTDTNTDNAGVEVLVQMGRPTGIQPSSDLAVGYVREIREGQGSTAILFDHIVLSAAGSAATTLLGQVSPGAEIGVSYPGASPGSWTGGYAAVGGGEVFLISGVVVGGQAALHPRTAVAVNNDYVFFVVVDGRDPGVSIGMSMTDLGNFCKDELGATSGINLDGGGSSAMVVNGTVVNNPSDGSERAVANGLMMVALQPKVQATTFSVSDQVKTTGVSNVRLGPGTNYGVLTSVIPNSQGVILDHSLRGVFAKGYNWWPCDFGTTSGWVAGSLLTLTAAGDYPTITQHPADEDVCLGTDATFSVTATGQGTLTYQWQEHGVDLDAGAHYVGVTTPSLTVTDVTSADTGSYRCVVSDANGSTTSYTAALLPPRAPTTISQHPESQDVPPAPHGSDVLFAVTAGGEGVVTYRWQKDGNDLSDDGHYSGVLTPALTIHNVERYADDGTYRVRAAAACGAIYSNEAALTVITPDFDRDDDVDQADFGHLQSCLTGSGQPQTALPCMDARMDGDSDVDFIDRQILEGCFSGPNQPYDPQCMGE